MNLDTYQQYYRQSPAWSLLRARSTPAILAFFAHVFKDAQQQVLPWFEAEIALEDFLTYSQSKMAEEKELEATRSQAARLLNQWVSHGWLRKFPNDLGQDMLELSSHSEKALLFAQSLERQEFVGTESRFKDILHKLQEMVEGSRENPKEKIQTLTDKIAVLKAEIKEIKRTGQVEVLSDTQLKERTFELSKATRELLSDFKEVAQNFKEITRTIYKKQAEQQLLKGELVGYALDQIDALKLSDQGKSFYAFWAFLISSQRQEELSEGIQGLLTLLESRSLELKDPLLPSLKRQLYASGQAIFSSNQLLAEKLNRIVSERNLKEQKRALQLIDQIRQQAMEAGGKIPSRHFGTVPETVEVSLPLDRPLGEPPTAPIQTATPLADIPSLTEAGLEELFTQFFVDRQRLEGNISSLLRGRAQLSLTELLEVFPLQQGLSELLTYFAIASASSNHFIHEKEAATVFLDPENQRSISIPQLIFGHP